MTKRNRATVLLQDLEELAHPRVLVLGDLILDRYTWGNAERISQEAPVIVLSADQREQRLGGAANVCAMLRGLEAEATCVGVTGSDESGKLLRQLLEEDNIRTDGLLIDRGRPTTVKERFIGRASARHPNQILRVDFETRAALGENLESRLVAKLKEAVPRQDAVLISDYHKGVCTPRLVRVAIDTARASGIPVLVDPARGRSLQDYRGATVIKPNRSEAEQVAGRPIGSSADAATAGREFCRQCDFRYAVITLDRDGMQLVDEQGGGQFCPTVARSVYDITGAGDIVLAMLGICFADGLDPVSAVELANVAGGLEVERPGVALVRRDEIRCEILKRVAPGGHKLVTLEQAAAAVDAHRLRGDRVVFTNGCFDLLHIGHVSYLSEAAALGDLLVVGVNSDASVRRLKGESRPVIGEQDRAAMLAALSCVDFVVIFDDATPHRLLHAIRPHVLVKGGTYLPKDVVGREVVEAYGGEVRVTNMVEGISTTRIVESLREQSVADRPLVWREAG